MNGGTRIKAESTNGRNQEAWIDVTKHFPVHKTAVSTNWLNSLKQWNIKYAIKISSAYIASALLAYD